MKSMCQDARRNSPSVADCRPTSSCIAHDLADRRRPRRARSSSASMRPAANASRARGSSGGRSRLPTWSARNGGSVRWVMAGLLPSRHARDPPSSARRARVGGGPRRLAPRRRAARDRRPGPHRPLQRPGGRRAVRRARRACSARWRATSSSRRACAARSRARSTRARCCCGTGPERWVKLAFEVSPQGEPMVVSVATNGRSDDANAFVVAGEHVWLRVSRLGPACALHARLDDEPWRFVRHLALAADELHAGFLAQSPIGDGARATFDAVGFVVRAPGGPALGGVAVRRRSVRAPSSAPRAGPSPSGCPWRGSCAGTG